MPLTVTTIPAVPTSPQFVSPAVVHQRAAETGNPNASQALAVTVPVLTVDQTGLQYEQRPAQSGVEFRFNTGTLTLRLRHDIYISSELSPCTRNIWAQHENLHVADNNRLLGRMDSEIRSEPTLRAIFINRQWLPRDAFDLIQTTIQRAVGDVFQRLTREAVRRRDTRAEYARVCRLILTTCVEPYYHTVEPGDTLSRLADFYYGNAAAWRSVYERNRQVIGASPNLLRPGQRLLIPPRP
jgi:nucleoid-associated protein YgaU